MANTDQIINDIIKREGPPTNDPTDKGGRTAYGISEKANPDAWKNGPPTAEQAKQIYLTKYVNGPGFDKIQDSKLQAQLVDMGVNSGPSIAIQKLQVIVGVPQDGKLGPATLQALASMSPTVVNTHLVIERVKLIGRIVSKNPSQVKFLNGWLDRALQFLE